MSRGTQVKTTQDIVTTPSKMMQAILEELRLLRNEVMSLFPEEYLDEYVHPDRIKRSYEKATKEHPPASLVVWK